MLEPKDVTGMPEPSPNTENQPKPKPAKVAEATPVKAAPEVKAEPAAKITSPTAVQDAPAVKDPRTCPHCGWNRTGMAGGMRVCEKCSYTWPK